MGCTSITQSFVNNLCPVGMIHPAIGGALGAGANLAGAVDVDGALVYTANNLIVDGMASDYALKIE
ncbi:MAG: hypothetical protein EZS28_056326, partial [Streblomastix strix]